MMRLFNHIFPTIDMCILHYLSGNRYKYKFINFYLAYKACFPPKFHEIFKRYITLYLSCETVDLNGVTDLIRVLHNNIQSEKINNHTDDIDNIRDSDNSCNSDDVHIETKKDVVTPRSHKESKYQTKKQLKYGLSMKLKNTMQYKFIKTPILIENRDPNSNQQLLSFVLSCIGNRKESSLVRKFVNNFIHELISSRIYYDIDKFKIFKLVYTSWPELESLFLNSEYMMSKHMISNYTTQLQSETLIYKLLETCRDAYSHKLYEEIYKLLNANSAFNVFLNSWFLNIYTHEGSENYDSSNTHNPRVITKTYQLALYINSRVNNNNNKDKDQLYILDKMTRVHIEKYIRSYTSIHLIIPSLILTSPLSTVRQLTTSLATMKNILNMNKNPIIGNIFNKYISDNICDLVEFSKDIQGYYASLHEDKSDDTCYSKFLDRTITVTNIIRRYRHFQNTKELKVIINKYMSLVEKSQYYNDTYVELGISNGNDDSRDSHNKYKNDIFRIYAYPHVISDILRLIDFIYPRIKLTKKTYIFLVNFFIYITKHPSHWTPPERDYLLEKLTHLLIKYSKNRIKIKFINHEKNKIFIHALVTTLSNITKDTLETFDTISRMNKQLSMEELSSVINGSHSLHLRKYILQLILRHLDEPTLKEIYYSNIIIYKLINTLNQILFIFTPKSFKSYFDKYPKEQKKIIKYINNNTTEITTCLDNIYGKIIEFDTQKGRFLSSDIHEFNSSLVKNIVISNIFFKPENLKGQRPMSEKDVAKFKHLKPLTYHRIDLTQYPNIAQLEELHTKCEEHMATLNSEKPLLNPEISGENNDTYAVKLDPIMGTPIVTPLALPDCDEVMDKSILEEMLMYNNTNPFTQKDMFMSDVLAYNETEKAKEQISKFMSSE